MSPKSKLISLTEAIDRFVPHGAVLYLGGFVQQEPFAAVHEIIRQGKKNLTLSKCAGMILLDQLIGAGAVKRLITAFCWNPLPAPAHCFARGTTKGVPNKIELEEYSILGLSLAYLAGALDLPYVAAKTMLGSGFDPEWGQSGVENRLKFEASPFNGERVCLIPPIKHDVGIIQVQRSDPYGNAQSWGLQGDTRYGIMSCKEIIVCAEEIVESDVIRHDPNRTLVPGFRVQAVVEESWGGHPVAMPGFYDMDWPYFAYYEQSSRTEELFQGYLKKWVYGVKNRKEYLELLGRQRLERLRPEAFQSEPVDYGRLSRLFEL